MKTYPQKQEVNGKMIQKQTGLKRVSWDACAGNKEVEWIKKRLKGIQNCYYKWICITEAMHKCAEKNLFTDTEANTRYISRA